MEYRSQARYSSVMSFSESCKMLGFSNDTIVLGSIVDETLTKHQQDDIIKPLSFFISFFSQVLSLYLLSLAKQYSLQFLFFWNFLRLTFAYKTRLVWRATLIGAHHLIFFFSVLKFLTLTALLVSSQKLQNHSLCECKDFFKVITDVIANMVDSRVHKEKLLRDYESSSEFNYDGFTMGVAFLLKVNLM